MYNQINIILSEFCSKNYGINTNISYEPTYSLYDSVLSKITANNYIAKSLSRNYLNTYYNSLIWHINNPIDFSRKIEEYKYSYSHILLFFHGFPYNMFKKEDLFLFKQIIQKYQCYSYINNNPLQGNNLDYLKYGIPVNIDPRSIVKNRDILVLCNKSNNDENVRLYENLKNQFEKTNILLIDDQYDFDHYINQIAEYKIIIDTASYFNILCGISVGCYGITTTNYNDDKYVYTINNYKDIIDNIKLILNNYEIDQTKNMIDYIKSEYNYELFEKSMNHINNTFSNQVVKI